MASIKENCEISINKQVKDILRITSQNEVIQSFVRSDVSSDSSNIFRDSSKTAGKEKKSTTFGWKPREVLISGNGHTDKGRELKNEINVKSSSPFYQQLGKDAHGSHKGTNKIIGNKRNRRHRLFEEVYTDKDRAAAVNLGTRDIKQSLKLKKLQDRSRILEISEEAHPGTLLTLAIHRYKTGDIYVAMKFVNKALELNPYDKNALVARSKCHLFIGNAQAALEDAEKALKEDKFFIKGLYQKAEALYHLARFEYSLMYFYRGLHIRSQREDFRQGAHKAQHAIMNIIGKAVPTFTKFFLQKKCNHISNTLPLKSGSLSQDINLLKELHVDKIYFEKLTKNPELHADFLYVTRANLNIKKSTVISEVEEGMKFLENRQNFWKQQQAFMNINSVRSSRRKNYY